MLLQFCSKVSSVAQELQRAVFIHPDETDDGCAEMQPDADAQGRVQLAGKLLVERVECAPDLQRRHPRATGRFEDIALGPKYAHHAITGDTGDVTEILSHGACH